MKLFSHNAFTAVVFAASCIRSAALKSSTRSTLLGIILADDNYSILAQLFVHTGLTEILSGSDPYTVFAPSNEAFNALPPSNRTWMLAPENIAALTKAMKYHVLEGGFRSRDLEAGNVTTYSGGVLEISERPLMVNTATVVDGDIKAKNGVIHAIDEALVHGGILPDVVEIDWLLGLDDESDRTTSFKKGTILNFNWEGSSDVVVFPNEEAFNKCDFSDAVLLGSESPLSYTLKKTTYFASSVSKQCSKGLKLEAAVLPIVIDWLLPFVDKSARAATFEVGDVLKFVWNDDDHDVVIMEDKMTFEDCDFYYDYVSLGYSSPVTYTITEKTYFTCTVPGHCESGQILDASIAASDVAGKSFVTNDAAESSTVVNIRNVTVESTNATTLPANVTMDSANGTVDNTNNELVEENNTNNDLTNNEPELKSIAEMLPDVDDLSTLNAFVEKASFSQMLGWSGPYTVFAPSNEAFDALPQSTVDFLMADENEDALYDLLTHHTVSEYYNSSGLVAGMIDTDLGEPITISLNPIMVNTANVVSADIKASNGIIHIIDRVLIPEFLTTDNAPEEDVIVEIDWLAGFSDASARATTVAPGTTLKFSWQGYHDVVIFPSKQAFEDCDFDKVDSIGMYSPVTYTVTDTTYFACTVGTHCKSGQKLATAIDDVTSTPVETNKQSELDTSEAADKELESDTSEAANNEPESDTEVDEETGTSGATLSQARGFMSLFIVLLWSVDSIIV